MGNTEGVIGYERDMELTATFGTRQVSPCIYKLAMSGNNYCQAAWVVGSAK
jgi:hypothetical protein